MKLDLNVINAYIEQREFPKEYEDIYTYTGGKREVQMNRQEVCIALRDELNQYCTQFPIWNRDIYQLLFADQMDCFDSFIILPIFGANEKFDSAVCLYQGTHVLMIDVLNIADYTQILEEMKYILHNQIHLKLSTFALLEMYPKPTTYKDIIQHHYFVYGCSHYLSWKDGLDQLFDDESHKVRKQIAAPFYIKAVHTTNPVMQEKVLASFDHPNIWMDIVLTAGLYMFADVYNKGKEKDLLEVFKQGPYQL